MTKRPFIPEPLPPANLHWERLAPLINKATMALGRYDGTLDGIINPVVLLSPITEKEAVLSSRIEGTIASLIEVLGHEAGQDFDEKKINDINEIINYRTALLTAEDYLADRPITLQLIRELHALLMKDVRGGDKTPGQFRETQNHIGKKNTPIDQARFIPPDPLTMRDALGAWHNFMELDYSDPLVQLAIIHAQFEIIHPFNDGNGRIGRMLIPLFLYRKHMLRRPMFYLSEYLEEHDQEYRDTLLSITDEGDWQGWIEFFLRAIHIQADRNNDKAKKIHALYERLKIEFTKVTRSQYSQMALDAFFKRPICNTSDFQRASQIRNTSTAGNILRLLESQSLIKVLQEGAGRRPTIYVLWELVNITEGHEWFTLKLPPAG